jgi:hypothetical protein
MTQAASTPSALPKQIQATIGSEAWWATHIGAALSLAVAVISIIHPAWVHETSAAQAWVVPVALLTSVLCVIGYLTFALLHHKISRQTYVADVEAEIPGLKQAAQTLLPLVDQVPALKSAIDATSQDISTVKAQLGQTTAGQGLEAAVEAALAKRGFSLPPAAPAPAATAVAGQAS